MKRFILIITCLVTLFLFTSCAGDVTEPTTAATESVDSTVAQEVEQDKMEKPGTDIVGTWVCKDINDNCYFIFDKNGDAYAKWGTSTVYGYYDYYMDEDIYDIDVPNFLYNEYTATFSGDEMILKSDESRYEFEKATMPAVTIKAPDNLKTDEKLIGDWQSEESYECYRFNEDHTAVITDMYNYSTVDCKYSCENGVVTVYYMTTEKQDGYRELEYKVDGDKLTLVNNGATYNYERVSNTAG